MILLTRDTEFIENSTSEVVYPSTSYPYNHLENTFGPLQNFEDAIFDASVKRLITQQGSEEVYSDEYGMDWITIRTQSNGWIQTHLPDMIKECLMKDDRVTDISVRVNEVRKDYIALSVSINGMTGDIKV